MSASRVLSIVPALWLERGARVSDLVGDAERDLLPVADLTYSLIVRIKNDLLDVEVIQFSLIDSILNPGSEGDPSLNVNDRILIFSAPDLEDVSSSEFARQNLLAPVLQKLRLQAREGEPTLSAEIVGAVKAPGQYPILSSYEVGDLIKAAGGLQSRRYSAELPIKANPRWGRITYSDVRFDGAGNVIGNARLQSRDIITVEKYRIGSRRPYRDSGRGCFPGVYVISPGETISQVIERAGGLKSLPSRGCSL